MPRKSKIRRIQTLTRELQNLPFSACPNPYQNFYPFSNERKLDQAIYELSKSNSVLPKKTIRVGILIGQSSFCSLLPELHLHCDVIVFNDINPFLIKHVKKLLELLIHCKNIEKFNHCYKNFLDESPIWKKYSPSQVNPNLAMRKEELKQFHFLSSQKRFEACQFAARNIHFAFCRTNLFLLEDRKAFFECFNKRQATKITFFNVTNLHEWDAVKPLTKINNRHEWLPGHRIKEMLRELNIRGNTPILMASFRACVYEACALEVFLFFSSENYVRAYWKAIERYLQFTFPNSAAVSLHQQQMFFREGNERLSSRSVCKTQDHGEIHEDQNPENSFAKGISTATSSYTPGYKSLLAKNTKFTNHIYSTLVNQTPSARFSLN